MTRGPPGLHTDDLRLALTVLDPWASAIVHGPKNLENRGWRPPAPVLGRLIWIHASVHYDEAREELAFEHWPEGRAFMEGRVLRGRARPRVTISGLVGVARVVGCIDASSSPWFLGPLAWELVDRAALVTPLPVRGGQKLWTVPPEVRALALAEVPPLR